MNASNRLIIIDKAPIDTQLMDYFLKFNYELVPLQSPDALSSFKQSDAILIDLSFVETDPDLISYLFHQYKVPLILIAENKNEGLSLKALEDGADDFLLKPLHPRELHARIAAISRRVFRANQEETLEKDVFLFDDWRLYPGSHQLFSTDNQELILSSGEYDLLLTFIKHPQQILSRDDLIQHLRCSDFSNLNRRIDVQISRLRQKIEQDSKKPALIKTIRNGGYLFTPKVLLTKEELPYEMH